MATKLKDVVKEPYWIRCWTRLDDFFELDEGRSLRPWYKPDANSGGWPNDALSPTVIEDAHELGQSNEDNVESVEEEIDDDLKEQLDGPEYADEEPETFDL